MERPVVSVIIPVLDLEPYLREALDSVLAQTFQDLEIILVDDGSSDRSREIISDYERRIPERIRPMFQQHQGAAAARNRGIDAARGEWIAFLDGDDAWKPTKLEQQLRLAAFDPHCNLIATAAERHGEGGLLQLIPSEPPDLKLELLRRGCFITLSTVLIRRELVAATRFDERLEGAQDIDLLLRLADAARLRVVPDALALYRFRAGAISDLRSSRYLQLHRHYQVARRELERLRREQPQRVRPQLLELRQAQRQLAHEAAYTALMSERACLPTRVRLAAIAVARWPGRLKSYRLLLQSLLPGAWNVWLTNRRRRS